MIIEKKIENVKELLNFDSLNEKSLDLPVILLKMKKYTKKIKKNEIENLSKIILNFIKKLVKNKNILIFLKEIEDEESKKKLEDLIGFFLDEKFWEKNEDISNFYFFKEFLFILKKKNNNMNLELEEICILIFLTYKYLYHFFNFEKIKNFEKEKFQNLELENKKFEKIDFNYYMILYRFVLRSKNEYENFEMEFKKFKIFNYLEKNLYFQKLEKSFENKENEIPEIIKISIQDKFLQKSEKKKKIQTDDIEDFIKNFFLFTSKKKLIENKEEEKLLSEINLELEKEIVSKLFLNKDIFEEINNKLKEYIRLFTTPTINGLKKIDIYNKLYITKRLENIKLKEINGKLVKKILKVLEKKFILLYLKNNYNNLEFKNDVFFLIEKIYIKKIFEDLDFKQINLLLNKKKKGILENFIKKLQSLYLCFNFEKSLNLESLISSIKKKKS